MNRRERRAAAAARQTSPSSAPIDIAYLTAEASRAYREGQSPLAELICKQILARAPDDEISLNLLGVIYQESGRHRLALRVLAKAIALDGRDAIRHYNIARSYQVLGERTAAAEHFRQAVGLGMGNEKTVEEFVMQNPLIVECVGRAVDQLKQPVKSRALFDTRDIEAIGNDIFLRCALRLTTIHGVTLELFLTRLRFALLSRVDNGILGRADDDEVTDLSCALAQQCFINEYVFAQSEEETRQISQLRDLLLQKLTNGDDVSPRLLAALAAYLPLHSLPAAESLLAAQWPNCVAELLQQQIREPVEEQRDRGAIPALTPIDDETSMRVMQQYDENPYPRWTTNRLSAPTAEMKRQTGAAHSGGSGPCREILVAGCGSGQHACEIAQYFPDARIVAVDISLTSLAYARRKTREEGLQNIEYAQADIVKLAGLGRTFDRIEAIGVLHHLAEPNVGWRALLSLLRPNGIMRVGLYSEAARRSVVEGRTLIAERGYRATAEDIRAFRQAIIRNWDDPRWKMLLTNGDFYSMSGCRDLLFNVMEHRFTIPEIAAFLNEHGLSFLGFELDARIVENFQRQHPAVDALTDLERWNAFETANPQTFRQMYIFSVCKNGQ
jgi:2-polyprenyl-3-methyl-5-hydroxy-6-metoxy-1,4-benzoquinol methylase/tetratricopeptide (TPR) repeat protein